VFSDQGKILNSILLKEYQQWKVSMGKEVSDQDMKDLKEYLNASPYAQKATVWTEYGNNEGYYGLSLKSQEYKPKLVSSTGKKVEKRTTETNELLGSWESIAKAAVSENISSAKLSRSIKQKTPFQDYYYCTV
jgi:hypothetical protein